MTEQPSAEKKRKGLLGFYVGTGIVALLLVGFYFAWTPLRIAYWEREAARSRKPPRNSSELMRQNRERELAVRKLLQIGPQSSGAMSRLLRHDDERTCWAARRGIEEMAAEEPNAGTVNWTLPLVIDATDDPRVSVVIGAIRTAECLAGRRFFPPNRYIPEQSTPNARRELLDWWEREGRAKYGSGE